MYRQQFQVYTKFISLNSTKWALNPTSLQLWWRLFSTTTRTKLGWPILDLPNRYPRHELETHLAIHSKESNPVTNLKVSFTAQQSSWHLFVQSWKLQRPTATTTYKINRYFRLMFMSYSSSKPFNSVVSARRYYSRWVDSYNLIFNLAYSDAQVQAFSNKLFLEEVLVFNWHQSHFEYKLFKYTQQFFAFRDLPHGSYVHSAVFTILLQKLDYALVIDLKTHRKLLGYLRRFSLYTIGLVPSNHEPWQVSYPIPMFADSNVIQYYFLRWLFFITSQANKSKYQHLLRHTTLYV